jgi:hypothetical protein
MSVHELRRETTVTAPLEAVFSFFADARNLETITPPFLRFRVLTQAPIEMAAGTVIEYRLRVRGVSIFWRTLIETWNPPYEFSDRQERGPYRLWHHTHRFRAAGDRTVMEDIVRYALPFGLVGDIVNALVVRQDVAAIFDYREARIREIFGEGS